MKEHGGWIGVDLDGTLAEYFGWQDGGGIGAPIRLMVDRVLAWRRNGIDVRIFTARVSGVNDPQRDVQGQHEKISAWCLEHLGEVLPITNVKDYQMMELWDDRAVQVTMNIGTRADGMDHLD